MISEYTATKLCRHGTFLFNRNDTFIGRSLELYGEWCEAEVQLLAQVVKAGDFVLDIGANIGTHTVPFSRMVGETGCVMAFEPQRLVFQNLCANLALNGLRNVVTKEVGVLRAGFQCRCSILGGSPTSGLYRSQDMPRGRWCESSESMT